MKRTELATAAIHVAHSIEAHLTGAVATISQRNQGVSEGVGISVFDFSFLSFKAKAFRFCHFFCPLRRLDRAGNVILSEAIRHLGRSPLVEVIHFVEKGLASF